MEIELKLRDCICYHTRWDFHEGEIYKYEVQDGKYVVYFDVKNRDNISMSGGDFIGTFKVEGENEI